ncbi:MAG: DUF2334 domain-containing protein [bacterium]
MINHCTEMFHGKAAVISTACRCLVLIVILLWCSATTSYSLPQSKTKNIIILVEGDTNLKSIPMAGGRQLATLFGHFDVKSTIKGVNQYTAGEMNGYDLVYYLGDKFKNTPPTNFLNDILTTRKDIVWLNTGFAEFSKTHDVQKTFGFSVSAIDSSSGYEIVKSGTKVFTKGDKPTAVIQIADRELVKVLATTYSPSRKKEIPYIVKSKNLTYIGDSPFSYASETDRYLLFADMLHDILGEQHEESHSAIIRIEDISPMDDPERLRDIADLFASHNVPFLVGVIPFYVNPSTGTRLGLSDKPELVDALKYVVHNGGALVMHGSTHQYKGVTASDFEFWNQMTNKPIADESESTFSKKIESGIQEFMKNGLYPIVWETPHYTGSFLLYKTIAKYFSSAMEPRLAIEDIDQSQFFPYIIAKDLFGQKLYPENLGYVPFDEDPRIGEEAVQTILRGAKANLAVRDGFAACFFHSFNELDLLEELVDGILALGYKFYDLRDQNNWVKTSDRIILTGSQDYTLKLNGQYLSEAYYDVDGQIKQELYSENRIDGTITKSISLAPGELYRAEPVEYRERKLTMTEKLANSLDRAYQHIFTSTDVWKEARVAILWNHYARGSAYNDQASFASTFQSINIKVDTIFLGQQINLQPYNLVVVPYVFIDSLSESDYTTLADYVKRGGNMITDTKSSLTDHFGIKFSETKIRIRRIRDRFFPEEAIAWRYAELVNKIEIDDPDEILCSDEVTQMPMVIGKHVGKGKIIFFNSRFDPYSQQGYSLYPYLLEYVRKFFNLSPIVRRDNLEVYFDTGFRINFSTENLIKQWVTQGIRIIHAAGWHQYPHFTFDYRRLIDLAHANGMLVYAWLEPPQVSQKFWLEHPEWREKNYKNLDVQPSWRYPVAMTDPKCLEALAQEFNTLLEQYDWDGVNLAELYFEAGKGLQEPNLFTPMHPSAKSEIFRKYGIDMNTVFDSTSASYWKHHPSVENSITTYRVNKLREVYELLLSMFERIAQQKAGFEIMVTAMESLGSPELREYIGVDMKSILELQKKFQFTLQIEDPELRWSSNPQRYIEIGNRYRGLLGGDSKLALDLNILTFRKGNVVTPFPTLIQTGTECFQLIRAAALGAPRFTIYSESSVNPQDMTFLPFAASPHVQYRYIQNGFEFYSPYSFTLQLPPAITIITVDGALLVPHRENLFTIPAGTHSVRLSRESIGSFSASDLQAKILSCSGNLTSVLYGMHDMKFTYESTTRTLISVNRKPTAIKVDQQEYHPTVMKGNDCFTIFLPPGNHEVELRAGDAISYGINLTSIWSSTGIAIFGTLAVAMLFVMYLLLKTLRKKYSSV